MKLRLLLAAFVLLLPVCAGAHPPTGIVVDHSGNVFFSDLETVWKLDTSGKLTVFRAGVSGRHVHELAIDDQDTIYGADFSYEAPRYITAIWQMSSTGKFSYLLEPTDNPPAGLSIWRDKAGNSYFVDQNKHTRTRTLLLRRSPRGEVITLAGGDFGHLDGKGTAARFGNVGNIAVAADGTIYVTDGSSLRRVSPDGTVVTITDKLGERSSADKAKVEQYAQALTGVTVDASQNVFVADPDNRRLWKIAPDRKLEVVLRSDPPYFPSGVYVGPDGSVYVLEVGFKPPASWSSPRVRRIARDGAVATLATIGETSVSANQPETAPAKVAEVAMGSNTRTTFGVLIAGALVMGASAMIWRRRRQQR